MVKAIRFMLMIVIILGATQTSAVAVSDPRSFSLQIDQNLSFVKFPDELWVSEETVYSARLGRNIPRYGSHIVGEMIPIAGAIDIIRDARYTNSTDIEFRFDALPLGTDFDLARIGLLAGRQVEVDLPQLPTGIQIKHSTGQLSNYSVHAGYANDELTLMHREQVLGWPTLIPTVEEWIVPFRAPGPFDSFLSLHIVAHPVPLPPSIMVFAAPVALLMRKRKHRRKQRRG